MREQQRLYYYRTRRETSSRAGTTAAAAAVAKVEAARDNRPLTRAYVFIYTLYSCRFTFLRYYVVVVIIIVITIPSPKIV